MEIIAKRDEARAGIPAENSAPSTTEICPYTRMGMVVQILLTVGSICVLVHCASVACFEYARWNLVNVFTFLGACGSGVGWGTQPLTEISTRNIFRGVKVVGAYFWQPRHLHAPIVLKSGILSFLEPSGPFPCPYMDLFTFTFAFLILSVGWRLGISFPLRLFYPQDERVWLRNDPCPVAERIASVPVACRNHADNAIASHQLFKAKWLFCVSSGFFFLTFRNCSFCLQNTFKYFVLI